MAERGLHDRGQTASGPPDPESLHALTNHDAARAAASGRTAGIPGVRQWDS